MKEYGKLFAWLVGVIIFVSLLGFVGNGMGLISYKIFGPAWEDARRDVYENTNSFTKAKVQEATKLRLEYLRSTDPAVKNALQSTIQMSFADFDVDKYVKNDELRKWVNAMLNSPPIRIEVEHLE
jgi:hypothetical protein